MAKKTALIIRHVPYEGVAGYRVPIEAAGYEVDRIDVSDPDFATLDLCRHDLLIMMGGPMGVYEQESHPWIPCQLSVCHFSGRHSGKCNQSFMLSSY